MSKNVGKKFEEQFKNSVPKTALIYRLPDSTNSFSGGVQLRFTRRNPFDFLIFDTVNRYLYALELKTVAHKSISFERDTTENGEIHVHQIRGLREWNKYNGVRCGFVINFREIEKTIFIDIDDFNGVISDVDKKSFTIKDLDEYNVPYKIIGQKKMRTRYKYDVEGFLRSFDDETEENNGKF